MGISIFQFAGPVNDENKPLKHVSVTDTSIGLISHSYDPKIKNGRMYITRDGAFVSVSCMNSFNLHRIAGGLFHGVVDMKQSFERKSRCFPITDREYIKYSSRSLYLDSQNVNSYPVDAIGTRHHIYLLYNEQNTPHLVILKVPPALCTTVSEQEIPLTDNMVVKEFMVPNMAQDERVIGFAADTFMDRYMYFYTTHRIFRLDIQSEQRDMFSVYLDRSLQYRDVELRLKKNGLTNQEAATKLAELHFDSFFVMALTLARSVSFMH